MAKRFLDPSTLTRSERGIALSAWLGVINAAIPWWYTAPTYDLEVLRFNAGVDWSGVIAWACFGVAAVLVLVKAWIWPEPAPHRDGLVYVSAGSIALASLTLLSVRNGNPSIGFYVALVLAFVLTVAGTVRRKERLSGWR